MEEYIRFDVKRFLEDSVKWDKQIKNLEFKAEKMIESSGMALSSEHSKVQTSGVSDSTAQTAIRVSAINDEIQTIKEKQKALKNSISALTDDEKCVIDMFFFTKGRMIGAMVNEFSLNRGISISGVYSLRRTALDKIESEILDCYFLR